MKYINFLFVLFFFNQAISQTTGVVTSQDSDPIIGASVVIGGTTTGVITDIDGRFTIGAKQGETIVFSFIGYETYSHLVVDDSELFIILVEKSIELEGVVLLGYSQKTKTEISSAVTVLNSKELNDAPATDVATLLQGKVAGVQVVNSSGEPGSSAQIRIRGISTIKPGNAEPLYVVDGIIGGAYDPADVETITVLKDAGATGLYGARANKGVIVITTKKAKTNQSSIEFSSTYGYNVADHGNITMMSGEEFFNDFSAELYRDYETHEIDKIKFYKDYPQDLVNKNFNWVDEVFKPAAIQKHHIAASGRSEKYGYYISGTYYDEGGTYKSTDFKKLNLRANTDFYVNDKLKISNNFNLSSSKGNSYSYLDLYYAYLGVPWDNPYNEDKSPVYVDGNSQEWWSRDHINPLHSIENSDYNYKGISVNYDFIVDYKLLSWLAFRSSNRLSFNTNKSHRFVSPLAAGTYHDKGFVGQGQDMWYGGISTNLFLFNKDFGSHSIDGLVGSEFDEGYGENLYLEGKGLPEGFEVPTVASSEYNISGSNNREIFRSFISQVNYNYKRTYFLTGSYRIDASSNFPSGNRIAHFPSLSASWLLNRMSFLEDNANISLFKIRSSFGVTGDPDIGASRYLGLYALNTQYNGNPSATPFQLANPDLTWEKTFQFNVGFDLGFYKDRISLNLDLYNNKTNDLLVLISQPLSQGFEFRWENSGSVLNRGYEIALTTENIKRTNFSWSTSFVFGQNKNKLSGIKRPFYTTIGGVSQVYRNDNEIYTFVLPKWLGVDPDTGAPQWEKLEKDAEGNVIGRSPTSKYSEAEPQEVGNALPKFTGGFSSNLTYKSLSLNTSITYQYGNDVYNFTRVFMDNDGHEPYYNNMQPKSSWSRWEKPGDIATHPSMQNSSLSKEPSSRYIEDGSFMKLRTIALNYKLPTKWIKRANLKECSIGMSANNIYTLTNFWGQDPEVTLNQQAWQMPGVSDFKYPNSKQFLVNLNIKF